MSTAVLPAGADTTVDPARVADSAITTAAPRVSPWSAEEFGRRFGDLPLHRIRFDPPPGTATIEDALHATETDRPCELYDGTLVEKTVGFAESKVAVRIGRYLGSFVDERGLGSVVGADGIIELPIGQVRIPDVAYCSYERLPADNRSPVPEVAPDLAVEVLSPGNTRREMDRKREEYFRAGVRLLWYVHPETKTVEVFTPADPETPRVLGEGDVLDGGDVLPGFAVSVTELFAPSARPAPPAPPREVGTGPSEGH